MNKRGQFFLVGAFVIVGIILGLSASVNFAEVQQDREYFYDQAREVEQETKKIMDYGVFYNKDVLSTTSDFLFEYNEQIGQDDALFIYKADEPALQVYALYFEESNIGSVSLLGGTATVPVNKNTAKVVNVVVDGENIIAYMDGREYKFELREGYNLFYALSKEEEDERLVAVG